MAKKLETKEFPFVLTKIDPDDDQGKFTGYASVFGAMDSYGDTVVKGAFKKTLKESRQFPMLWSHYVMEPIGIIGGHEDEKGLWVEGQLNLKVQRAKEVYELMKQGAINGLSIGYQTLKEDVDRESNTRLLKEIKLWEISPCVFQACPGALVGDVKSNPIIEMAFGEVVADLELKPYPNEHAARLQEPGKFDEFRRKADGKLYGKVKVPSTIDVIWGHLKDGADDDWAAQALRFPTKDWAEEEARKWLKDNEIKAIDFEPAKEEDALPGPGGQKSLTEDSKSDALHLLESLKFKL